MLQTRSDPIYPSTGKPKGYFEKYINPYIVQYSDPESDGLDEEIIETHRSNNWAVQDLDNGDLVEATTADKW